MFFWVSHFSFVFLHSLMVLSRYSNSPFLFAIIAAKILPASAGVPSVINGGGVGDGDGGDGDVDGDDLSSSPLTPSNP
jgi:hypothetical protein